MSSISCRLPGLTITEARIGTPIGAEAMVAAENRLALRLTQDGCHAWLIGESKINCNRYRRVS